MNNTPNKESTLDELIAFLELQPGSRPKVIADALGISRQYVQKLLAKHAGMFVVTGVGPNRFYRLKPTEVLNSTERANRDTVDRKKIDVIERNFYNLTPLGEELEGQEGFVRWCNDRNLDVDSMQKQYVNILNKYYPNDFASPIDFTNKLKHSLKDFSLQKVWAVDYYNFEIFGKTKLGNQVMIAKQTADEVTVATLIKRIAEAFLAIESRVKIDAVALVSPTIQRQQQLMSRLDNAIDQTVPRVKIYKVGARILIAQKTLKYLKDRILNAEQTFVVESSGVYESVLIIDDALGSGATLNEISKQIVKKGIAKKCYGLVLVASPSGYEVIQDA